MFYWQNTIDSGIEEQLSDRNGLRLGWEHKWAAVGYELVKKSRGVGWVVVEGYLKV